MEPAELKRMTAVRPRPKPIPIADFASHRVRLTNGHYSVWLTAVGSGGSDCGEMAVSRWLSDRTSDFDGFHIYLRDLDDHFVWSAGFQPTRVVPDTYEFRSFPSIAEIVRTDREIECQLTVCIAPTHDFEVRRYRLTNCSDHLRRIELTSYVEFVLADRDFDTNHPTFSKLFVETQFRPKEALILARRRPRDADELERWGVHRLLSDANLRTNDLQFETNRRVFVGRGRNLARPRALDRGTVLSGDVGPVLDPIGSLRTAVTLSPGETRAVVFLLGAAVGRHEMEQLSDASETADADAIIAAAEAADVGVDESLWIAHPSHLPLEAKPRRAVPQRLYVPASEMATPTEASQPHEQESLQYQNSYGGFSADGREYVVSLRPDGDGRLRLPPQPWVNVLANKQAGCLVTERGAGYTWAGNSRHNRLSAWHNDPVCDPFSEALWIREDSAQVFWSPLPGPTPDGAPYEVRHGFGYTTFLHENRGLRQEVSLFMAAEDPVKVVRVKLRNDRSTPRRLTLFSYVHWCLGTLTTDVGKVSTDFDETLSAILAQKPDREVYGDAVAFSAVIAEPVSVVEASHTADRESFLGKYGDLTAPAALVARGPLDRRTGNGLDPCAAWQIPIEVPADGEAECTFLLGEAPNRGAAAALIRQLGQSGQVQQAFDQTRAFWRDTVSAIEIETPSRELDLLVNGWLVYQNLSCRMWGRSAYYQPGGAYGFRDQLQDSAAMVFHRPDITRQQILLHAGQQFVEGDVMHWWHDDTGLGLRTRFSDDLVWLPYATTFYLRTTGDEALLDETAPLMVGETLAEGRQEACVVGLPNGESVTIYEHCCRALDRALTVGRNGLPLIGSGDWNDGFSRVGQNGKGESVWLGFFLYTVLGQIIPYCIRRDDLSRAERYTNERVRLATVLNSAGWDGGWYRRAYYDNGQPLGSAQSDECQIDALAQAWAVISGVAPRERAVTAIQAVKDRLVDEDAGLIRLLTPPFDRTPNDPGYVKGYVPGVRENGGQYTHGVLWFVRAVAEMGFGTRAVELLKMLSPVTRGATAERVAIYQTEPYVVAADVYGEPPHVGRGGWTWYTGSAGWMFRVAVESILGFSLEGGREFVFKPAISSDWPRCKLTYRLPDERTQYKFTIENPNGKETGVTSATLDGRPIEVTDGAARIPIHRDGNTHHVIVRL